MAHSFIQYQAEGVTYAVPFQYISKAHVSALVNGVKRPFTWLSVNTIQLSSAPVAGQVVEVRRDTPADVRLVDFVDGSILGERDLDLSSLQLLFVAQEGADKQARSLQYSADGTFDAGGRRVINVADPILGTDAVNRQWAETAASSNVAQAISAAGTATGAASSASASAGAAGGSQAAAKTSEDNAKASENAAAGSASTATQRASEAGTSASNAAGSASSAAGSASGAAGSASAAAGSASAAATSATNAASAATRAETAAANVVVTYSKDEVDTKVGAKLDKAGGWLEGTLNARSTVAGALKERLGAGAHLEVRAETDQGAAAMTFHRSGAYATWFGLDTDNEFKFGGWSEGAASYRFWTSKNLNPGAFYNKELTARQDLSGAFSINMANPYFDLTYGNVMRMRQIVDANGTWILRNGDNDDNFLWVSTAGAVWTKELGSLKGYIDGKGDLSRRFSDTVSSDNTPYFNWYTNEGEGKGVNADTFYFPFVYIHDTNAHVGHREQMHFEIRSTRGPNYKFLVGCQFVAKLFSGGGNIFAVNDTVIIMPGANPETEAAAAEFNTDVRSNIARKVILQLVDVASSGGKGAAIDAALLVTKQHGAFGNSYGVQIGSLGDAASYPVNSGIFMSSEGTVQDGFDLRRTSITSQQALLLATNHRITWAAGEGGMIRSDTDRNTVNQVFFNGGLAYQHGQGGGFRYSMASAALHPETDAAASLGTGSQRWNTVYASTGAIQTSDARAKRSLGAPSDALLDAIGDIELVVFQYLASIAEKGEDAARKHSGVMAQQVAAALVAHGLNPADYSFWCEDPWMEEVDEEQTTHEPVYTEETYDEFEFVIQDDGTALNKAVQKVQKKPVLEYFPVFNEDGTPHMTAGRPAKLTKNEDGETVVETPATEATHTTIARQKTEAVTKTVRVTKQKLDADGNPMNFMSIRYTDLSILLHAWTRRELLRLRNA